MTESPPIIAVHYPTKGTALAAAALARRFSVQPRIVLASELRKQDVQSGTRVIFVDYLVALANSSPIPELLEIAKRFVKWGAQVLAYRAESRPTRPEAAKPSNSFLGELIDELIIGPSRELRGYTAVVAGVGCWCDKPIDDIGIELSDDGTNFDHHRVTSGILAQSELSCFDESPNGFRRFISDVNSLCSY